MEACNRHYFNTTGQSLTQLMSEESIVKSGFQGNMAPYIMSAIQRNKECDQLLNSISHPTTHNSRKNVSLMQYEYCNAWLMIILFCSILF